MALQPKSKKAAGWKLLEQVSNPRLLLSSMFASATIQNPQP
jgi:hypothetical protein